MRNELGQWLNHQFLVWQLDQDGRKTVGEFAKYLGVSRDALYKWMNGQRVPDLECVEKLADKLGPEVYALVGLPLPNQQLLRIKRSWEDLSEAEQEAFAAEVERMAASNQQKAVEKKPRERVSKKTPVTRPAKSGV
jgi:predicted transcriptional regulator